MNNTNRTPLRILHTESLTGPGGQTLRVLNEARGMLERGHQVTLICRPETFIYERAEAWGIPVVPMDLHLKSLGVAWQLRNWLRDHPQDVINTHSSGDSWTVAAARLLLKHPAPVVRTRHNKNEVGNNFKSRWLYTRASRFIVTTGEKVRQRLIEYNGYPPERIESVPSGVSEQVFHPVGNKASVRAQLGLPQHKVVVGMVTVLSGRKGFTDFIRAAALLDKERFHWVLVGDNSRGNALEKLKALAASEGLEGNFTFAGFQAEVAPWMQAFDIFCFPTYFDEGVPQVVLQAMLCQLPIITTPMGSISDAIEHEMTGLMVEPRDTQALKQAILRFVEEPALGKKLAENAHQRAQACFTERTMLDRMERIFYQVAQER